MKNAEVVKSGSHSLVEVGANHSWLGRVLSVDSKVPRLLLMQSVSDFVNEDRAKKGDVVRSTTAERVGGINQPIPMIILSYPKQEWLIEVKTGKRFEFVKTLPRNRLNEDLPWKFTADEDGNEVPAGTRTGYEANRVRMGTFFALLPGDMDRFISEMERVQSGEMPDLSVDMSPVQIRCRSFSYQASLNIEKILQKIAQFGKQPWQFVLNLSVKEMKNEDNAWFVFDFEERQKGAPTPEKYAKVAEDAFIYVQQNSSHIIVDETLETSEASTPSYSGNAL